MGPCKTICLAAALGFAAAAPAQQCPRQEASGSVPSATRPLEGKLLYHDGLRKWIELKLDAPQCGQRSIQLTRVKGDWAELEGLRGCHVRTEGAIENSPTGYYSLDLFQDVQKIAPIGDCTRQPSLAAEPKGKPSASVYVYTVEMQIPYGEPDRPINFLVTQGGQPLGPWQSYANYWLTGGGDLLYAHCAEGFYVDQVYGPEAAHPVHFTEKMSPADMAEWNLDTTPSKTKKELTLGFTCQRKQ